MSREISASAHRSGPRGRIVDCGPAVLHRRRAAALAAGDIVAMPTETVYGPRRRCDERRGGGADLRGEGPAVLQSADRACRLAGGGAGPWRHPRRGAPPGGGFLAGAVDAGRPGARRFPISDLARAGLDSIGLRVPAHPAARDLLVACARPLAAPRPIAPAGVSPTNAADVAAELGPSVALILDGGGSCPVGGGIDDRQQPRRQAAAAQAGGVTREAIEEAIGHRLEEPETEQAPRAPGMLASHYAPRALVRLEAVSFDPREAVLAFGAVQRPAAIPPERYLNLPRGATCARRRRSCFRRSGRSIPPAPRRSRLRRSRMRGSAKRSTTGCGRGSARS